MLTEWKVGDRLESRWEIHKIMRGGMGVVYVVNDLEWKEVQAAKTFQDEVFARNPTIAPMFTREALAWVNLDAHPNIANALFVQEIEGKPLLFLEYVSGGDLSAWIGTPRLTEDLTQALRFAIAFCDGMIHAHSKGIEVHRDIKPQNCLITADGILKVTDFGLAKVLDNSGPSKSGTGGAGKGGIFAKFFGAGPASNAPVEINPNALSFSRTGSAAGTCTHMAPEQFVDSKHVGVPADIYSFGVMLYQMFEGRLPFVGRGWDDFERMHKSQPVPPMGVKLPALRGVVERCLAKQPTARYPDFAQVREPLAAAYQQVTGSAAPRPVVGAELDASQWLNKGASLGALGLNDQALRCYERALEFNPNNAEVWSNKGNVMRDSGKLGEALTCYDKAIAIDSRADLAFYNKGGVLDTMGRSQDALVCLDQALALNPLNHWAWSTKGVALGNLGRSEESIASFDQALRILPTFVGAWASKGNQLSKLGRHAEALAAYNHALETKPDFVLAWVLKGDEYMAMNQAKEALDCYDRGIKLDPGNAIAWASKAEGLEKLGRPEEALKACDQAIEIDSRNAGAWLRKGILYFDLGKEQEAVDCCAAILRINPSDAETLYKTGVLLKEMRRAKGALMCYEKALAINPDMEGAWLAKANALVATDQAEESLAAYDHALTLNPRFGTAWHLKGLTLAELNRYREGLECFERAQELGVKEAADSIEYCRKGLADSGAAGKTN
jgi:tetratricopeptide (TPR) repeat protein